MKIFAGLIAALIIIMVLCATANILIPVIETPNVIMTDKLSSKPEKYFVITNPDPIILKAISTLEPVRFSSFDETEFDELAGGQHGACNIGYQNNYYFAGSPFVEPLDFYIQIFWVSFFGFIISTGLLVSFVILKAWGPKEAKTISLFLT